MAREIKKSNPNLISLIALSGVIAKEVQEFEKIKKKAFFKEELPRHLFFCSETEKCLLAAAFAK